ncbi:MAG: riboflavin synthase [Alphaproteobacteria bacterium]|nr:riboflavin synthase [Alphaproteobacteria bacterium]
MFTGIVTDVGVVRAIEHANAGARITIGTAFDTNDIAIGASIACSGACLTVVDKGPSWLAFDAVPETLARTGLGTWCVGSRVNLERALRLGDELGGHMVTGHVDGQATVASRAADGDSVRVTFRLDPALARFIAEKGSVAVDGVSLTVTDVGPDHFAVALIPHTLAVTTLGDRVVGDPVNIEIDMFARYVAQLVAAPAQEVRTS